MSELKVDAIPADEVTLKPERIGLWQVQGDCWSQRFYFPSFELNALFLHLVTGLVAARSAGLAIHWTPQGLAVELYPEPSDLDELSALEQVAATLDRAALDLCAHAA